MGYKIVDFDNDVIKDGFPTYTDAWKYIYRNFTKEHMLTFELKVRKEEEDEQSE